MILAGDIGGTSSRLALFEADGGRLRRSAEETLPSRDYQDLTPILKAFLARPGRAAHIACLGVPGPVRDGRCRTTNLPWLVDAAVLSKDLGFPVLLLNDLEAAAHGLDELQPEDCAILNEGAPGASGNRAIVAAGTGLGEAGLFWDGTAHRPFGTEGGHASFAPADPLQADLLRFLARDGGHVSWERVLSGPGLLNVYTFLRDADHGGETPALAERLRRDDPPAVITDAALKGESPLCIRAVELFAALYGAEAGNLALKIMATGGVWLGGGIAPRILPFLKTPAFREAFASKGRMRPLLETMPVRVILRNDVALLGAARRAAARRPA
jgi:glucokinase